MILMYNLVFFIYICFVNEREMCWKHVDEEFIEHIMDYALKTQRRRLCEQWSPALY